MKRFILSLLFPIILFVNGYWLREERVPYIEKNEEGNFVTKYNMSLIAQPPLNLSAIFEKYIHQWKITKEGAFYIFNVTEPKLIGHIPGVVMSAKQAVEIKTNNLQKEAEVIQKKMEKTLDYLDDILIKANTDFLNIQIPRLKYLSESAKNNLDLDEIELRNYDREWIFNFAIASKEVETIMSGYRFLLKKLNFVFKKLDCAHEGARLYQEGHDVFAMVYPETMLNENSSKSLNEWSNREEPYLCQFVEASEYSLNYELNNAILNVKNRMNKIIKGP